MAENQDSYVIELESLVETRKNKIVVTNLFETLSVGTDFDSKEVLFRNLLVVMGPQSEPILLYQSPRREKAFNCDLVWFDPKGNISDVHRIRFAKDAKSVDGTIKLANKSLTPGKWSVALIQVESDSLEATLQFLVLPTHGRDAGFLFVQD
jgi:hypothetical protein